MNITHFRYAIKLYETYERNITILWNKKQVKLNIQQNV